MASLSEPAISCEASNTFCVASNPILKPGTQQNYSKQKYRKRCEKFFSFLSLHSKHLNPILSVQSFPGEKMSIPGGNVFQP
ncbi:hypothetical protein CEXT_791811 [Caerostris extrusa]|uniref:Uncharacterized protein n=1 Tax=Caerostris extrusa TaxID=172846 RepID=A0AAV4MHS4_CAEEX|nr:hypothetical protein CEXT_791811 [Caerostris extrusa]